MLDGGNVVDNFIDRAILTTRVVRDNPSFRRNDLIFELGRQMGYSKVRFRVFFMPSVISVYEDVLSYRVRREHLVNIVLT